MTWVGIDHPEHSNETEGQFNFRTWHDDFGQFRMPHGIPLTLNVLTRRFCGNNIQT